MIKTILSRILEQSAEKAFESLQNASCKNCSFEFILLKGCYRNPYFLNPNEKHKCKHWEKRSNEDIAIRKALHR